MYSCSLYFEPNFIEKFLWESAFKFWPNLKWRKIKIGYLAAILKRYNIFIFFFFFFCRIVIFYSTYMVQISLLNSDGKVVFLRGFHGTPRGHQPGGSFTQIIRGCAYRTSKIWLSLYQFFAKFPTHQYTIFKRKAPNFDQIGCFWQ